MQSVEVQGRIRIIVFLDIVAKFPELESARSDGGRRSQAFDVAQAPIYEIIYQNKCLTNIYLYVSNLCLYFSILFVQLPPSVPYSMWEQLCLLLSSLYQYKCVSYSLV